MLFINPRPSRQVLCKGQRRVITENCPDWVPLFGRCFRCRFTVRERDHSSRSRAHYLLAIIITTVERNFRAPRIAFLALSALRVSYELRNTHC